MHPKWGVLSKNAQVLNRDGAKSSLQWGPIPLFEIDQLK